MHGHVWLEVVETKKELRKKRTTIIELDARDEVDKYRSQQSKGQV